MIHLSYLKDYLYYAVSAYTSWRINRRTGDIHDILYIRLDHLGDAVLSLPVLESLRLAYPESNIDVLVSPDTRDVYSDIPFVRQCFISPGNRYYPGQPNKGLYCQLRAHGYSLIADLRGDWQTLKLAKNNKTVRRIDDGGQRLHYIWRHKVKGKPRDYHELDFNIVLLKLFGIPVQEREIKLHFDDTKIRDSTRELAENRYVVIHPFAGWQYREWERGSFQKVIDLIEAKGLSVIVTGKPAAGNDESPVVFSGKRLKYLENIPLRDLYYVIQHAQLYIGNDSGPIHLAACTDTPIIGLYGPNTPAWFGPVSDKAITHYARVGCSPCDQRKCIKGKAACMEAITLDEVINSINQVLAE